MILTIFQREPPIHSLMYQQSSRIRKSMKGWVRRFYLNFMSKTRQTKESRDSAPSRFNRQSGESSNYPFEDRQRRFSGSYSLVHIPRSANPTGLQVRWYVGWIPGLGIGITFFSDRFFNSKNWKWFSESCWFWGYQNFCPIPWEFDFEIFA